MTAAANEPTVENEHAIKTTLFDLICAIQDAADETTDDEELADDLACAALVGMREQVHLPSVEKLQKVA